MEVRDRAKQMTVILESVKSTERDVPDYLEADHDTMKGKFLRAPKPTDVPYPVPMNPSLVVEFYSR
jgi:small subunit ribosomal protein S4